MKNTEDAALARLLDSKYAQALRLRMDGARLYRESGDCGDWYERRPEPRVSADTGNEYALLISEFLPSQRGFPKRNRCVIAAGRRVSGGLFADFMISSAGARSRRCLTGFCRRRPTASPRAVSTACAASIRRYGRRRTVCR